MSLQLVTLPSSVLSVVLDLRAGTDRAVVRSPQDGVTVEPVSTDLAVVSARVVRAVADSGLLIAVIRMSVTVAGNTPGERSPVVLVIETQLTFLTELSSVAVRAGTSLHPGGCLPLTSFLRGLQDKLVNPPGTSDNIRSPDLDGGDVGQNSNEILRSEAGGPAKLGVLVKFEGVLLHVRRRNWIILSRDRK